MKKTLLVLVVLMVAMTTLFANGGTEAAATDKEWAPEQPITQS